MATIRVTVLILKNRVDPISDEGRSWQFLIWLEMVAWCMLRGDKPKTRKHKFSPFSRNSGFFPASF